MLSIPHFITHSAPVLTYVAWGLTYALSMDTCNFFSRAFLQQYLPDLLQFFLHVPVQPLFQPM